MRLVATGFSLAVEEQRTVKWNTVGARGLGVGGASRAKHKEEIVRVEVKEINKKSHYQDRRGLLVERKTGAAVEFSDAPD